MTHTDVFRWLRAEHEHRHPFAVDRFARDILEELVTIIDDMAAVHTTLSTDIPAITAGVAALNDKITALLAAQAANLDPAQVTAGLQQLQSDAAAVHAIAAGLAPAPAPAASTADSATAAAPVAAEPVPAPAEVPAEPTTAPEGTLTAAVQVGPAPEAPADLAATA